MGQHIIVDSTSNIRSVYFMTEVGVLERNDVGGGASEHASGGAGGQGPVQCAWAQQEGSKSEYWLMVLARISRGEQNTIQLVISLMHSP